MVFLLLLLGLKGAKVAEGDSANKDEPKPKDGHVFGAMVLSGVAMLFMLFAGRYVAPLFVKPEDTELLAVSIVGMKLFSLSYLTGWVDMCFSSYFTALEQPGRSMLVSFLGTLVFPIAALFVLTACLKLNGVWLSSLASCTASAVFTIVLYLTLKTDKKESIS